jgi:hypothetical protein
MGIKFSDRKQYTLSDFHRDLIKSLGTGLPLEEPQRIFEKFLGKSTCGIVDAFPTDALVDE